MITTCSPNYQDFLVNCDEFLRVNAVFIPTTAYTWIITDKFGHEYSGSVTTDEDGVMDIAVADLPEGLLNPFGGTFVLKIQDTECQTLPLRMMGVYPAIEFEVKAGTREKNTLGCEVDCSIAAGSPSNSAVYEYTILTPETDTRHIDWTIGQRTLYGNNPMVQVYEKQSLGVYVLISAEVTLNSTETILDSIDIDFGGIGEFMVIVRG
jgi:hypothetical protein